MGLPAPDEAAPWQDEEPKEEEEEWGNDGYGEEEWPEEEAWGGYEEEAGGAEAEWDEEADAGGEGEECWDRGDWSQDRRGDWQWSVDFTKVKAADAPVQPPAVDLAAIVAAAVKAAVASVQA